MIGAADAGDPDPPRIQTGAMRATAWKIAQGADPLETLSGPKVRAFYRAITGDTDAVTVDRWAARVAEGRDDSRAPSGRRWDRLETAYRVAAATEEVGARDLQAAVWCAIRGGAH